MRFANRALAAGGLGFAAAILAGCGSSGSLLSVDQASSLKGQLAQVSQALAAGHCDRAQSALQAFQNSVANLNGVDGTLVSNLDQGASTVAQLAARRCPSTTPTQTQTTATQTQTQTQTTTTPTQTQTTTTPTQTQTTTTPTQTQTTTTPTQTQTTTTPTQTQTNPGSGGAGLSGSAGGTSRNQGSSGSGGGIAQ